MGEWRGLEICIPLSTWLWEDFSIPITHYTRVGVQTLMENDGKAGISSMFKNINFYSLFREGEK